MVRLVHHSAQALATVTRRRLHQGPRLPSWPFRFELMVEVARSYTAWLATLSPPDLRRAASAYVDRSAEQRLVRTRQVSAGGTAATWIVPPRADGSRVVVWVHGGAYVFGSTKLDEAFLAQLAVGVGARVLSLDYRLAPEHPCPAAVEDLVAAHQWLLAQGHRPEAIAWAGSSAGGGIGLAALMALRDRGLALPACAALLSPHVYAVAGGESLRGNAPYDCFGEFDGDHWIAWYAGRLGLDDPRVSPGFGDLRGLPKLLIHAGGAEKLRDDIVRFADGAKAAGVDVQLHVWPEMVHVFHGFGTRFEPVRRAHAELVAFLRDATAD